MLIMRELYLWFVIDSFYGNLAHGLQIRRYFENTLRTIDHILHCDIVSNFYKGETWFLVHFKNSLKRVSEELFTDHILTHNSM